MDVLQRKLGRADPAMPQGADRAWRLALARAARDALALALDVAAVAERPATLAELVEGLEPRALLAMLDRDGGEELGLFAADPALLAGLVALMTTGSAPLSGDSARKPTRTDAAMVAPLVDAALAGWADDLLGSADAGWATGWRYASHLADARPLALLLDDTSYRLFQAEVALPDAGLSGRILLALPAAPRPRKGAPPPPEAAPAADTGFQQAFARQVQTVAVRIEAELVRLSLPLSRVLALQVGEVLPLAEATVARLVLRGVDGQPVAEGRLGQMRGMRAVRLCGQDHPALGAENDMARELPPAPDLGSG